ncbi:hypothetical protein BT93_L2537 [Corymbia citriodora subsp. variegata]|uniref:Uncharacterized protein n=1 Tax=Corymbia citriodora subsp. variegata TaxID=360336 RepID=A0A8T0CP23_CORYI|nr:hypothetical protein BT93_L2537 [Corymbia citriodora subsp. variegata]
MWSKTDLALASGFGVFGEERDAGGSGWCLCLDETSVRKHGDGLQAFGLDEGEGSGSPVKEKKTNAEEALKSSQKENPFGSVNASFELQCNLATPKTQGHGDGANAEDSSLPKQRSNTTPKKQSASQSSTGEASELQYIKLKFEKMTSMVDKSHGKLLKKTKSSLKEHNLKDQSVTLIVAVLS